MSWRVDQRKRETLIYLRRLKIVLSELVPKRGRDMPVSKLLATCEHIRTTCSLLETATNLPTIWALQANRQAL